MEEAAKAATAKKNKEEEAAKAATAKKNKEEEEAGEYRLLTDRINTISFHLPYSLYIHTSQLPPRSRRRRPPRLLLPRRRRKKRSPS